ncbi:hypothetical protein C8N24_0259 [Solirubrobacter pauli]|uniref:Uncharacterized protein n=1 Tax=Solirubrobacter pauli TaxID=166793 RepID=A0A660L7W3_9ACTN|nr:hypothetical protein [Solirubrobacter pauli]RKQ90456.1 hypothetical protein C8N24_0259 [Solirubrobacter pauli]
MASFYVSFDGAASERELAALSAEPGIEYVAERSCENVNAFRVEAATPDEAVTRLANAADWLMLTYHVITVTSHSV